MTAPRLVHASDARVDFVSDGRLLCRYVYRPDVPAGESPRPYCHPLRTLSGEAVTGFRPADHLWHHGLSLTSANLSGQNFWGGPTYVRDQGYVPLDNHGRIEHAGWDGPGVERLSERLRWVTRRGTTWLQERRELVPAWIDEAGGDWAFELAFELRNVAGERLEFRSPTTEGRPAAGYGGLFWRGPDCFAGGTVRAPALTDGSGMMGERAAWLAYTGRHDGSGRTSTVVFVDHPSNPRHPTQWFVRSRPYAGVAFAYAFDEPFPLEPGQKLTFRYRVVVADGDPAVSRIEDLAGRGFRSVFQES